MPKQFREIYIGDNLDAMAGGLDNESGLDDELVDTIYLDPPFNSKRTFAAPISSKAGAKGQEFKDTWFWDERSHRLLGEVYERNEALGLVVDAAKECNGNGTAAYLAMMGVRLLEMERVLKPGGAIFLHCDDTASHYLKAAMDAVFGAAQFRNHIIWKRTSAKSGATEKFDRLHDSILFYRKKGGNPKFDKPLIPHDEKYLNNAYRWEDKIGRYSRGDLTAPGTAPEGQRKWRGIDPSKNNRRWAAPAAAMSDFIVEKKLIRGWPEAYPTIFNKLDALDAAGLVEWPSKKGGMPRLKRYLEAHEKGKGIGDLFIDLDEHLNKKGIKGKDWWSTQKLEACEAEKKSAGWQTQKPIGLVLILIEATTPKNGVVLDPFAGCGTACVAAELLNRHKKMNLSWIAIDKDPAVGEITQSRLDETVLGIPLEGKQKKSNKVSASLWAGANTEIPIDTYIVKPTNRTNGNGNGNGSVKHKKLTPATKEEEKRRLYGEQEGNCKGCFIHYRFKDLTVDHRIPQSERPDLTDEPTNLQLLCASCNSIKNTNDMEHLYTMLAERDNHPEVNRQFMRLAKQAASEEFSTIPVRHRKVRRRERR